MSDPESKRYYETVVETVTQQTGGVGTRLPPATPRWSLRTVCCSHGAVPPARFDRALETAAENGDVVVGSGFVAPSSPREQVTAAIPYVAERADAPQAFVAAANGVVS